jgi:hypothetical protein
MTRDEKFNCPETSPEELLLLAYGDEAKPRLAEHVEHCPHCRAYLAEVRATRARVRLPLAGPAESTVAAVLRQAEALAGTRTSWASRALAAIFARPLAPALAAAAALVVVIAVIHLEPRPASPPGTGPAADYLTGVSADLLGWGQALGADAPSGAEAMGNGHQPDNLNDLELAAANVERDLPLMNYSDLAALGDDDDGPGPGKE